MEERIKKLETITNRLMLRAKKRTSILIPPSCISHVETGDDIQGTIFRFMFPCDGTIKRGIIRLDHKPKKDVYIDIRLFNDNSSQSVGFGLSRKIASKDIDAQTLEGDCLEVTLKPGEEIITEVWISFTFVPELKESEAKSILISDLEKDRLMIEQTVDEQVETPIDTKPAEKPIMINKDPFNA